VSSAKRRPVRVLVVEDEPAGRDLIEAILLEDGHQVETAADGEEAWQRLQAAPAIDVVVADWTMPRLDGLELLARMKGEAALETVPVVFQTAHADREAMLAALAGGASYFVPKPIDRALLRTVVAAAGEDHERYRSLQETLRLGAAAASTLDRGLFHYRNVEQASALATLLSQACPDAERTVVGLGELLVNAVEHGNLGITYEDKTAFLAAQSWTEEVERRLALPENAGKQVEVRFERTAKEIAITIVDCGPGFDWQGYLTISPDRIFHSHGRGIAMANLMSFDRLEYQEPGNQVTAYLALAGAPEPD
jgi:CheY-like chemotaxis protein/anti-sigma regulatory factor (Ser/Thr protein kinase)